MSDISNHPDPIPFDEETWQQMPEFLGNLPEPVCLHIWGDETAGAAEREAAEREAQERAEQAERERIDAMTSDELVVEMHRVMPQTPRECIDAHPEVRRTRNQGTPRHF